MACSKIFSGDLPELLYEIIQYFRKDFSSLHSCILVNKLWCYLAIPILWEDPFPINTENYMFFDIYLHNLNENDKLKLNEYGINTDSFPSNTLFNYPSFIKHLDTWKLVRHITKWATRRIPATEERTSNYFMQNTNLSSSHPNSNPVQTKNALRLIYVALLKTIIENEAKLFSFEVKIFRDSDIDCFNNGFELILQNPNLTRNIKFLNLTFCKTIANLTNLYSFLKFLESNCNLVSIIRIQFQRNDKLMEKYLSQIINSQQNLKGIFFYSITFPLYHSLTSLKSSNTLKIIVLHNINFENVVICDEVFEQLNVLESIHIIFCHSLNSQQIISITNTSKLRTLVIDEASRIESIQLLLQKSGDYLENIGFGLLKSNESKQRLYELITKYCTKIEYICMIALNEQNIYLILDLIKHFGQNLHHISIEYIGHYYVNPNQSSNELLKLSSIIFQELGQILPFKLDCLNLHLMFATSDFEVFLRNSQNTFIKELSIKTCVGSEDILSHLEEYIMKKKKVKYLAFMIEDSIGKCRDLFSLKDEVKKFKLYNVIVQDYYNSTRSCIPNMAKYFSK